MRRLVLPAFALLLSAACSSSSPARQFSVDNALAHVRVLAGTIGSRPTGSDANRRAREYLVDRLRAYGYDVRLQEIDAERPGTTAHVVNIVATRPGRRAQAIALVSHYDSVPDGPGAADAAMGVAVCLEAGRVLAMRARPNYALAIVLTDGEELGLLGARAILKHPIAGWMRAVLNFEAIGSGRPNVLFETGPGSRAVLDAWAASAPLPSGASHMTDIYRRLPNNTDFTVFARRGIPGLNFAATGDGYSYHTRLDTVNRLDPGAVRQAGENAVATVTALDEASDLSDATDGRRGGSVYFDVLGRWAIAYRMKTGLLLFAAALLAAVFAWITVLPVARENAPGATIVLTAIWTPVVFAAVLAAVTAAAWLLRATRETYQPWYAHPDRFFLYLVLGGVLAGVAMVRLGRLLPSRLRGSTHPAVAWTIILPFWTALACLAQLLAPSASYLAVIPLLAAAIALVALPIRRSGGLALASAVALALACLLWVADAGMFLHFVVAMFGRLPVLTPVFVYPALLLFFGLFVVPPLLALIAGRGWRLSKQREKGFRPVGLHAGMLLVALFVFAAAWCWFAPAYTRDRPLQAGIYYVNDATAGRARWQLGSNEPGAHVGVQAPSADSWQPGDAPASSGMPLPRWHGPFTFWARTVLLEPPPVNATGTMTNDGEGAAIEITAVPREPALAVQFSLPEGIVPEETNLAGSQQAGSPFTAWYLAVPPNGVTLRARIGSADARSLAAPGRDNQARIVVMRNGIPGATWPKLPGWLPGERVAWQARSFFVLSVPLVAQSR